MKINTWGLVLSGIYGVISLGVIVYAYTCSGIFCGLVAVIPVMPWPFVLEGLVLDTLPTLITLIILNAIIVYFIGSMVSKLFKKDVFNNTSL